ncbi:hypothetical protein GJ496_007328 [Pomphorhynchus laevis]|nr:hypothetical protein GJ496_007328 [Pomphorhynchus laevis]
MALYDSNTLDRILDKHPPQPANLSSPLPPDFNTPISVITENDILGILKSSAPGSAAGANGFRPSHLVSLIGRNAYEAGVRLLRSLTLFTNMVFSGQVPDHSLPVFDGVCLTALRKKTSYKVVTQLRPI